MTKRTGATRGRAWALLVVASIAMFQLQFVMAPTASADNACQGAFNGSPSGTLAMTASAPDGSTVAPGQTIDFVITWSPSDWSGLDRFANCFEVNGVIDTALTDEDRSPVNDGRIDSSVIVPANLQSGDTFCARARLSGQPTGGNTSTQKSNKFCYTIGNAPPPDVEIEKTASRATVAGGESFSFTLTARNVSTVTANNVVISDTVPSRFHVDSVSGAGCSASGQTVTCSPVTLGPGATKVVTINVTATVGACATLDNTATVTATDDSNSGNNSDSARVSITCDQPDVEIEKSSGAPSTGVAPGDSFTYTITVTNVGGAEATGVQIQDTIPAGLSIATYPANCAVSGQNLTCSLGTVAAGTSESVTITVEASEDACPMVTNRATVTADQDSDPSNNTSDDVTTLVNCEPPPPPEPGISVRIQKTNDANRNGNYSDNEEARRPDADVPFLLVITNNGEDAWTITDLTDSFDGRTINLLRDKCSELRGVVLQPGESATCNFTLNSYSPPADEAKDNTADICVENMTGSKTDCDNDDSRVRSAEVLGRTITPTKTPPGGTAFTGSEGTLGFGGIALGLLLLGSGLLWVGYRRRQQYDA